MAEIAGLQLVTPSSVAGSGVTLNGAVVEFTGSSNVLVNGVFDSTYDDYLVVMTARPTTSNTMKYRLRVSSASDSSANYAFQEYFANLGTVSGSRATSQTSAGVASLYDSSQNGYHIYFFGPALAQQTAVRSIGVYANPTQIYNYASVHSLATAYDGFDLFGSYAHTGSLTVYGFSQ